MTMDEYLDLAAQYVSNVDHRAAIRSNRNFCKAEANTNAPSADLYIQQNLPAKDAVSIRSVLCEYGTVSGLEIEKAVKWLRQNDASVQETLCGPCVSVDTAEQLRGFLNHAVPVRSEFDKFCESLGIDPTFAMFTDFRMKYGRHFLFSRHHPFSVDNYFWVDAPGNLLDLLRRWYMVHSAPIPSDVEGYLSVYECAEVLDVKPVGFLDWLWNHTDAYVTHNGRCLIAIATAQQLQERWNNVTPILNLLMLKLTQIPSTFRVALKQEILTHLRQATPSWILPQGTLPQQKDSVLYTAQYSNANRALDALIRKASVLPLNCLKDITGMTYQALRRKVENGAIDAFEDDRGQLYISINERNRIQAVNRKFILLDDVVVDCLGSEAGKYDYRYSQNRENLIGFCEQHNWWGMDYVRCDELPLDGKLFGIAVFKEDAEQLKNRISLWLRGYQQPPAVKFSLLTDMYREKFPSTTKQLIKFECKYHPADMQLVDMTQLLYLTLPSELKNMDDAEIENTVVVRFNADASVASCKTLSDFLVFGGYTKRRFEFSGTGITIDTTAYPVKDFALMVWYIVNEEVIQNADLVNKAISNKRFADLWLYIALHVYASWRTTDYIRMLAPLLPHEPDEMLERIKAGSMLPAEAKSIAEYFIASNSLVLNTPNKTKDKTGVPKLYFYCPQSCMEMFGTILAIATAHYQMKPDADSFINPVKDWVSIKHFFGDDFLQACGNRAFSGRRANKALLQSIEYVGRTDDQLPPLVAYNLASIMRSHKLSYGKPSETTDIYLHDANFSSLTPEFVIYQMWERGVCSFVVDAALQICYQDKYKSLTVAQRTKAITSMGLTPANINNLVRCVQDAIDCACETVTSVFQTSEAVRRALETIALGYGAGKEPDGFCLLKAARMDCRHKERLSCLGCRYEIRTKALLVRYAAIHQNLTEITNDMSETEKARRKYLYSSQTYPAVAEILSHLNDKTADEEIALYDNLIKEVMTYGITDGGIS